MYITREIELELKKYIGNGKKQVIAIIGPRQSGKTTILQKIQRDFAVGSVAFVTFENVEDRRLFSDNIEGFKKLYSNFQTVIIDEFQYANEGGQKLKYLFDTTNVQYVISGSSSLELMFQTGKYLVGRMLSFILLPLSFREWLSAKDQALVQFLPLNSVGELGNESFQGAGAVLEERLRAAFEEYLVWGGYPAVALASGESGRIAQLKGLYDTYFLRDVRSLLQLATEQELVKLLKALALQIGNLVEYQELGAISGLKSAAIKKHLSILSQTYIINLLSPYFTNRRTELVKSQKVYFWDAGFRNIIIGDMKSVEFRTDAGALVENYAFRRLSDLVTGTETVHFWRTKNKAEVDFVFVRGAELIPFEVKFGNNPTVGKSLSSFVEKFSPQRAFVLTKNTFRIQKINSTNLYFFPVYYL